MQIQTWHLAAIGVWLHMDKFQRHGKQTRRKYLKSAVGMEYHGRFNCRLYVQISMLILNCCLAIQRLNHSKYVITLCVLITTANRIMLFYCW